MAKRFLWPVALTLTLGLLGSASVCLADTVTEHTTEKTTTYSGMVTDINPNTQIIILKSETSSAPTTYAFSKETVFLDANGNVVSWETVKNSPVTVYYTRDGDRVLVTRVVRSRPGMVVEKETTTTETR